MGMTKSNHHITRALSDGTGLSEEEIGLLVAATAIVTALYGLLRTIDAVLELWPIAWGRPRK